MPDMSKPLFMLGTTSSAFLSGGISYVTLLAIPSFLDAPNNTTLLTQWRHLVNVGQKTARTLAVTSALCNFCNAYIHWFPTPDTAGATASTGAKLMDFLHALVRGGRPTKFFLAGLATLSILPFTRLVIQPMNLELRRREEVSFNALDSGDAVSAAKLSDRGYLTPSGLTPKMSLDVGNDYFTRDRKQKEETTDLVRRWGQWNIVRAVGPLVGTWLAFEAL